MNVNLDFNILQVLHQGNGLIFLGAIILLLSLLVLVRMLVRTIELFNRRKASSARRPRLRLGQITFRFVVALIFSLLGVSVLFAGMTTRTYVSFTRADQVGIVECLSWNSAEKLMVVSFASVSQGKKTREQTYSLYGDQWEVSAHILKWDPKFNLLGLHTGYRLNQIKGSYFSAEQETSGQHRAYALASGHDWIWWILSRYGEKLPFVEAVYGNAVSRMARPGERFDVFVTTSGLSTRRRE